MINSNYLELPVLFRVKYTKETERNFEILRLGKVEG